ncbi:dihydroxyacetone kinase subunit DhaL [Streptomyces sp. NPDC093085]|uniref:dihydroxyacetone kinase subunit DhaL n=1 Tax=Streptomyces sp. NPDC093085 TaxID=3155068 RepID=UPI0034491DDC
MSSQNLTPAAAPSAPAPQGLTYEDTADWLRRFADAARAVEGELTELDQRAGDGDFGANLVSGTEGVRSALDAPASGPRTPAAPLATAARVFLDHVGGTSGPLFGLLFQELAAAVAAGGGMAGPAELAAGTAAGAAAVQRVGEAEVGDKTMVDALVPAADALARALLAHPGGEGPVIDPLRALHGAAVAAHRGARATSALRARRGRASYTGDHARGVPDPGALAVALLFASASAPLTTLAQLPDA